MSLKTTDTILGAPRGDAATAIAYARSHGAAQVDFVDEYITEVYRLAPLVGIDPVIVLAQSLQETTDAGTPWSSFWWRERLNPAGIGITGDDAQDAASKVFANGTESAQAQIAHLLLYTTGKINKGGLIPDDDPRYDAYVAAHGTKPIATTINDLAGTWATDPDYATGIVARGNAAFTVPDQGGTTPVPTPTPTNQPVFVIDAGHRSTDRSGNPAEMALTGFLADEDVKQLTAAGYEAYWWQRDLDRDSDPDETVGDLNTVALGIGQWIADQTAAGKDVVFWSDHYNGANSPVHIIVPDVSGLTTAYSGGAPADDTYANNVGDRKLAVLIGQMFQNDGLGTLYNGGQEPGIMREGQTGVGLDGFRLAVFAATVRGRNQAVRLVIEHGGTSDTAAQRDDFTRRCAAAKVRAVQAIYGGATPEPIPPIPPDPDVDFRPAWMVADLNRGIPTDHNIRMDVAGKVAEVKIKACLRPFQTVRAANLLPEPNIHAKAVGRLKARSNFRAWWLVDVPALDGQVARTFALTPNGSYVDVGALTPRVSVRPR